MRDPFPERQAGGFTRVDGSVQFYVRVRALLASLGPEPVVLDFGAGRGANLVDGLPIHRDLLDLRGKAKRVIGIDVDPAVRTNAYVTEAHVVDEGCPLPLDDAEVDLIVADHVFEHIADPLVVARELSRVLRAGGWLCARTPNKWGYVAMASRAVPNHRHHEVLRRVQPCRQQQDVFPTAYLLNTRTAIARAFPKSQFHHVMYAWEPEPAYAGGNRAAEAAFRAASRMTPERFRPVLLIFLQRMTFEGVPS